VKFWIGIVLLCIVLSFITYELGFGGGKREKGRNGNGPFGGMPFW
jgi:hypothetical protein